MFKRIKKFFFNKNFDSYLFKKDITIYCRSEKEARRVHYKWYKCGYNPKNKKNIEINKKGHLIPKNLNSFPVEKFWTTCGFYPIKIRRTLLNKKLYDKVIPNSIKFITTL